jgi:hypothetical protein
MDLYKIRVVVVVVVVVVVGLVMNNGLPIIAYHPPASSESTLRSVQWLWVAFGWLRPNPIIDSGFSGCFWIFPK